MKRLLMAACIGSLAACGADTDEYDVAKNYANEWEALKASVIYSYPADDQEQVPTSSPVVLRFSTPVVDTAPTITIREAGGADLTIDSYEWADNKQSLVLGVEGGFSARTEYEVVVPAINLEKGTTNGRTINFTTAALGEGASSEMGASSFSIIRTIPDNQGFDIVTDMSTFRVQFSQPLNRDTIDYGTNVKLATSAGVPVEAHVLVDGPYLTVDPKADLNPDHQYTFTVTTGVQGISGDALGSEYALMFTPADTTSPTTGERSFLVQDVADSDFGTQVSPFTGAPINLIPMASTLLGPDTATQSTGVIGAELAFAPNFPDVTPLRIPRGMLIRGEAIDVLIGGSVDAGATLPDSGEVTVTFMSDATGYMIPNPYSDSDFAPRLIHLYMDVGVSTDQSSANGAITQTIQHIELIGTALVTDGALEINAVGMVEPDVLGSEKAEGLLAFYMRAFDDQDNAPAIEQDTAALELQSWSIDSDNAELAGPGDPIIANFNKPVDPETVEGNVTVTVGGVATDAEVVVDGAAIVVRPNMPVDYSPENNRTVYEVTLMSDIADIHGNTLGMSVTNQFELEVMPENKTVVRASHWADLNELWVYAPVVLAVQPGYPCAIEESTIDLANGIAGRCAGGNPGTPDPAVTGYPGAHKPADVPADDLLPITTLPANRPIAVALSKQMDPDSIVAGETFIVEEQAADGVTWNSIDGRIEVEGKSFRFYPDTPWKEGSLYRYTIMSAGYSFLDMNGVGDDRFVATQDYSCDGSSGIHVMCSLDETADGRQLPIQTQVLGARVATEIPTQEDADAIGWPRPAQPVPVAQLECADPEVSGDPTSCPEYADFAQYEDWYATWGMMGAPNDTDAGGPPMVQHFYGGAKTDNVLQALRQAPVSDVNANFDWDRDVDIVAAEYRQRYVYHPSWGLFPMPPGPLMDRAYDFSDDAAEPGPSSTLQEYTNPLYEQWDPNGLLPGPNMAKLIMIPEVMAGDLPATLGPDAPSGTNVLASDANIGCGFKGSAEEVMTFRNSTRMRQECPEDKFTPLTSALFAEVTDETNAQGDVKVLIWPGLVMAASMNITPSIALNTGNEYERTSEPAQRAAITFPQAMRMRYEEDGSGNRTQLIEGWIRETVDGPVLEAEVDLYLDAPGLSYGAGLPQSAHSFSSYPFTMTLSGPVRFLEDGRMVVEQTNTADVELDLVMVSAMGRYLTKMTAVIPESGSRLEYVSEPIK